jgi:hypothetical protein
VEPGEVGREAVVEVRRGEGEELAERFDDLEESHITPVAESRHGQRDVGIYMKEGRDDTLALYTVLGAIAI